MNEMELSLFQKLVMCFCVLSLFLPFYCGGFSLYFWVLCILEFYFISCHVCVCVCVCDCVHIHAHICIHTNVCVYTHVHVFVCACVFVLSCVWLFVTPWAVARQAPLSTGFPRQEYWSGLPFPSPMHETEKWKWSRSVMSDSSRPHGLQPTRLLHPWDFPGKSTGVGCHCLLLKNLYNKALIGN